MSAIGTKRTIAEHNFGHFKRPLYPESRRFDYPDANFRFRPFPDLKNNELN